MTDGRTVLVVEDEPLARQFVLSACEIAGVEGLQAKSGAEALQLLEARPNVDLVYVDVNMPGEMDGLDLVHYVRQRSPGVAIIVSSGDPAVARAKLPPGAVFVPKPVGIDELVAALQGGMASQVD